MYTKRKYVHNVIFFRFALAMGLLGERQQTKTERLKSVYSKIRGWGERTSD